MHGSRKVSAARLAKTTEVADCFNYSNDSASQDETAALAIICSIGHVATTKHLEVKLLFFVLYIVLS